jgi:5-methylthioadenosine/S-adenosylhomocysteine deaminase
MKLSVGGPFRCVDLNNRSIPVCLGTDGAASNNSLSMIETMKVAALQCKHHFGADSITAGQVLLNATENGYRALGIKGGKIEKGYLADLILIDLRHYSMVPGVDLISNLVYSAKDDSVRYSIINGRIIMEDGKVEGEEAIITNAMKMAEDLTEGD